MWLPAAAAGAALGHGAGVDVGAEIVLVAPLLAAIAPVLDPRR